MLFQIPEFLDPATPVVKLSKTSMVFLVHANTRAVHGDEVLSFDLLYLSYFTLVFLVSFFLIFLFFSRNVFGWQKRKLISFFLVNRPQMMKKYKKVPSPFNSSSFLSL